ncbi:Pentapeptide repeat protein [Rhodobacteraceae bacterium KLH11]|nr:Pentapeptide repeat protein [Rhodobacteraceae bacterium KLH11]
MRRRGSDFLPDLRGASLTLRDLSNFNLSGAVFDHADLMGTSFFSADLSYASFFKADCEGVNFSRANLSNSSLARANLISATLSKANFKHSNFDSADLTCAICKDTDFSGASLTTVNAPRADFEKSDFSNAFLFGALLQRSNLSGASFFGANLSDAYLAGSIMKETIFERTIMNGIQAKSLREKDEKQDFLIADFSKTVGLEQITVERFDGDQHTKLPKELRRPDNWVSPSRELEKTVKPSDMDPEDRRKKGNSLLEAQIEFLSRSSNKYRQQAKSYVLQIGYATSIFRNANQSNFPPEDLLLVEKFNSDLRQIERALTLPAYDIEALLGQNLQALFSTLNCLTSAPLGPNSGI